MQELDRLGTHGTRSVKQAIHIRKRIVNIMECNQKNIVKIRIALIRGFFRTSGPHSFWRTTNSCFSVNIIVLGLKLKNHYYTLNYHLFVQMKVFQVMKKDKLMFDLLNNIPEFH